MRSSRWHAQGNVYLVTEESPLEAADVVAEVGDADGILEVLGAGDDWLEIAIWNPDGSPAEMSGNGTRIAARWLAERTGAREVTVRVGPLTVRARMLDGGLVEQDLGVVVVGRARGGRRGPLHAGRRRQPARRRRGRPGRAAADRAAARDAPALPAADERPGRAAGTATTIEARVWERGVGETASSGSSAVAVAAALGAEQATVSFPGGALHVRFEGRRALLTGPAVRCA